MILTGCKSLKKEPNIEPPEYMPGKNMLPLMKGEESWEDHSVYSESYSRGKEPTQLMLKKGDYKLIYTADSESGERETYFYDVKEDPWEMNDLMNDSDHDDLLGNYINELMNDYRNEISEHSPPESPKIVQRLTYDISWLADPWKPVKIDSSGTVQEY